MLFVNSRHEPHEHLLIMVSPVLPCSQTCSPHQSCNSTVVDFERCTPVNYTSINVFFSLLWPFFILRCFSFAGFLGIFHWNLGLLATLKVTNKLKKRLLQPQGLRPAWGRFLEVVEPSPARRTMVSMDHKPKGATTWALLKTLLCNEKIIAMGGIVSLLWTLSFFRLQADLVMLKLGSSTQSLATVFQQLEMSQTGIVFVSFWYPSRVSVWNPDKYESTTTDMICIFIWYIFRTYVSNFSCGPYRSWRFCSLFDIKRPPMSSLFFPRVFEVAHMQNQHLVPTCR